MESHIVLHLSQMYIKMTALWFTLVTWIVAQLSAGFPQQSKAEICRRYFGGFTMLTLRRFWSCDCAGCHHRAFWRAFDIVRRVLYYRRRRRGGVWQRSYLSNNRDINTFSCYWKKWFKDYLYLVCRRHNPVYLWSQRVTWRNRSYCTDHP